MDELREIIRLEKRLKILREEILLLESQVTKVNKELNPIVVQTSVKKDNMENAVIKLIEKKDNYYKQYLKYYKIREILINKILKIKNEKQMTAIYKRYVEGKKVSKIAEEMGLTYKWTQVLLKRGVNSYKNLV